MFVLLHSPLVGPATWSLVADELRRHGRDALVPRLQSDPCAALPYWQQHADAVVAALEPVAPEALLILVGHSGAGVLLPIVRQSIRRPVAAYLFVDAGLPEDGKSRLDRFEDALAAEQFRQAAVDGLMPTWTADDLREAIPEATIRQRFVEELVPMPLAVYEEPLPLTAGWPDAPCGYLRFGDNPAYDEPAEQARQAGWPYRELEAGHFHMLVDPAAVTAALLELVELLELKP